MNAINLLDQSPIFLWQFVSNQWKDTLLIAYSDFWIINHRLKTFLTDMKNIGKTVKNVIALRKMILKHNLFRIKIRASDSPWKTSFRYIFFVKKSWDQRWKKNNTHFSLRDDVINRVVLLKLAAKKYST